MEDGEGWAWLWAGGSIGCLFFFFICFVCYFLAAALKPENYLLPFSFSFLDPVWCLCVCLCLCVCVCE